MGRESLSVVHRLRERSVPAATDDRPPLLLLLHGRGSNELAMATLADRFDPRFVVISLRSPIEVGPFAYAWFHETSRPQGLEIDAGEAESAWEMAVKLTDEAVAAYHADPKRVFIAGFSQGGMIALAAMLVSPERFAGAVCMSGRLLPEVLPHAAAPDRLRGKDVLIVHGRQDRTLSTKHGRAAFRALEQLSLSTDYVEFEMAHTTTEASVEAVSAWLTARLSP